MIIIIIIFCSVLFQRDGEGKEDAVPPTNQPTNNPPYILQVLPARICGGAVEVDSEDGDGDGGI